MQVTFVFLLLLGAVCAAPTGTEVTVTTPEDGVTTPTSASNETPGDVSGTPVTTQAQESDDSSDKDEDDRSLQRSSEEVLGNLWTTLRSRRKRTATNTAHGAHLHSGSSIVTLDDSSAVGGLQAQIIPADAVQAQGMDLSNIHFINAGAATSDLSNLQIINADAATSQIHGGASSSGNAAGMQQVVIGKDQLELLVKNLLGQKMEVVTPGKNITNQPVAVVFSSAVHVIDILSGKNLSFLAPTQKPKVTPAKQQASGFIKVWGLLPFTDPNAKKPTTRPVTMPPLPTHKPHNVSGLLDTIFKPLFARPVAQPVQAIQQVPVSVQAVPMQAMQPVMVMMAQPQAFAALPQFQHFSAPVAAPVLPDVGAVLNGVINVKKELLKDVQAQAAAASHQSAHAAPAHTHADGGQITVIKTSKFRDLGAADNSTEEPDQQKNAATPQQVSTPR